MKRIITGIFLVISFCINAQNEFTSLKLRHIEGIKALDFHYGKSDYGMFGSIGYTYYYSDKYFISPLLNYEQGKKGLTNFQNYNIQINSHHTVLKLGDALFFNLKYGGQAGLEKCQGFENIKEQIKYTYGLNAGIQIEWYLINRIALLGLAEQQYNFNSNLGSLHYRYGLGLRFTIN